MSNFTQINWSETDGNHLDEKTFLLYADGELNSTESKNIHKHLEVCWSCRARTEKLQETINFFIDYRNKVLLPSVKPPPRNWQDFKGKLNRLVDEYSKTSLVSTFLGTLSRLFSVTRFSFPTQPLVRYAIVFLVSVVGLSLLIRFGQIPTPTVSANELLRHTSKSQADRLQMIDQPVMYQKLRVHRLDRAGVPAASVKLEQWNDKTQNRFRQAVNNGNERQFLASVQQRIGKPLQTADTKEVAAPILLSELTEILKANRMNPQQPLSADSYQAWRNSLEQKKEQVTRGRLDNQVEGFILQTIPINKEFKNYQIIEAKFAVGVDDWQPFELWLKVKSEEGDRIYEIREEKSEVVSLTNLSSEIFAETSSVIAESNTPAADQEKAETELNPSPSPVENFQSVETSLSDKPKQPFVATTELEVEVLHLLSEVGADLGEQINIVRTRDKKIRIDGIVETQKRKEEILQALKPFSDNPALRVEILTVSEAQLRQKQNGSGKIIVRDVEIEKSTLPVETELRNYFSVKKGLSEEQIEIQIRQLSNRIFGHSNRTRSRALAIKNLAERFTPAELQTMDNVTRAKWQSLIHGHAGLLQKEIQQIYKELAPIFPASSAKVSLDVNIDSDKDIGKAANRLYGLAVSNDQALRRSFALSAERVSQSPVKTQEFWRSLGEAESLAAKLLAVQ